MKYTIHGFSQKKAVELNLNAEDLLILRWFIDFKSSEKMTSFSLADGVYYWINYKGLLEDLPIVNCNKRNLAIKLNRLVEKKVLKKEILKQGGVFTLYKTDINYIALIDSNTALFEIDTPLPKTDIPFTEVRHTPLPKTDIPFTENGKTKDTSTNPSIKNKSTKHKYGEYSHVLLSDDEYGKLKAEYPNADELIKHLDEYCEMTGKKYQNYLLTIRKWVVDAVKEKKGKSDEEKRKLSDAERIRKGLGG